MIQKSYSLLIETSTERGAVFLVNGVEVLFEKELPFGLNNSKFLLPSIQEGFQQIGIAANDLAYIAVGNGPGSYTGIRVGAMAAKTLAYACKVPLIGVCTLACFVPDCDGPFAAIIDAKIGGAYILKGLRKHGEVQHFFPPQVCELSVLSDFLEGVEVLVTPYSHALREKLYSLYPNLNLEWQERAPDARLMSQMAADKFQKGEYTLDGKLELMYLRKTQAEIEKDKKNGIE